MIFNVSSAAQLQTALASAKGGDTISLAAGNYGNVAINNRNYSSAITIKSASGTSAHFDGLVVEKSSFINFESLDLGRALRTGEAEYTKLTTVQNSSNIKMLDVSIHGSLDNNASNDGIGLFVNKVNGFEMSGSNVEQVFRGVLVQQSYNVDISTTRFNEMRSDGINIAGVVGVTLDGNSFTNFRPVGSDHADAIQFWNTSQPFGSKDIVIKNNVIMNGTGTGPQGIFMNAANGWDYTNVLIENNMIYSNDSYHGIHIEGGNNVRIVGNTTLSHQSDQDYMWIKVVDVDNINLSNNLTERLIIGAGVTGLTQSNNQSFWTNPSLKALIPNLNHATNVADLIIPNVGYQVSGGANVPPPPPPVPAPPPGGVSQSVFGTAAAWETLRGTSANEKIYGMPEVHAALGGGTRDKIYGAGGADTFVLGDDRGLFYDDKSAVSAGRADHAAIMDFGADDKLQLVGKMSDYLLRHETINGILGTSIFRDDNRDGKVSSYDEYVAHVSGSSTALALTAAHFTFVTQGSNGGAAVPPPNSQLASVYGTAGPWETLRGTSADETIYGIPEVDASLGDGTRDKIYGAGGTDTFVLGDERGLFYDDKSALSAGRADHAAILDFGADDTLQLVGAMSDYVLQLETINGILGTSILRDDNGNGKYDSGDEYIAHVSGSSTALALTAANFTFVSQGASNSATTVQPAAVMNQVAAAPIVDNSWAPSISTFTADNLPQPLNVFSVDYFTALP